MREILNGFTCGTCSYCDEQEEWAYRDVDGTEEEGCIGVCHWNDIYVNLDAPACTDYYQIVVESL